MKLAIIGPQGSGKGTQSRYICEEYGVRPLSTGIFLREEVKMGTELGREAKPFMDLGELVPEPIVMKIVRGQLPLYDNHFLLDGFPRDKSQADKLAEMTSLDGAISIVLSREDVMKRFSGRYTSEDGLRIYNVHSPEHIPLLDIRYGKGNTIDSVYEIATGEELFQRDDDTPASIEKRLNVFDKETQPVIELYRDILIEVAGNQKPEEVFAQIKEGLDALTL